MDAARFRWFVPLCREAASWAFFLWGTAIGVFSTTLFAGSSSAMTNKEWPKILGLVLFGLVPLLGSILGLRNRRVAAYLFLADALLVAGVLAATALIQRDVSVGSTLAIAGTTSLFLFPGLFWLVTSRWEWRPLVRWKALGASSSRPSVIFNAFLLLALVLACTFASLYLPFDFNCYKGGRPVSVQTSARHTVFTGKVIVVGHPLNSWGYAWALVRVDHVYWGLPRWMRFVVFVRGYFKETDKHEEYFVDANRSAGLLTRFFPVVEFYSCCHSKLLKNAEVDLRVLREGPPKSGVRIIGCIYSSLPNEPGVRHLQGVSVTVTGPRGSTSTVTDGEGIYDFRELPPGLYSIRVGTHEHGATNLRVGDVWGNDVWLPRDASAW
jgi:hypothetical protein